jgi:O-antigen/teichoic acid export membrane protein
MHDAPSINRAAPASPTTPEDGPAIASGDLRRAVSRGAAATLVLRAGGMALAAIAGIVLARALGPTGYGAYSWAFALVAALAIPAALGADQLLVREAGIALDRARWDALRALVRSALTQVTLVSIAVAVLGASVLALAGGRLGDRGTALLVALPILPLAAVAAVAQGALLGLGKTARAVAPGTVGRQAAFLGLAVLAAVIGGLSASGAVALQLAATAVAAVALLALLRRALASAPERRARPRVVPRDWLGTSIPMGAAVMFLVVDAQVGLLALGAFGRTGDAGVYAAALQCTAPFVVLIAAGRIPLGAAVARLEAAGDRMRLQRGVRTATRGLAAASTAVAIVLLVAPAPILGLFGEEFKRGAGVLRLLALAGLVNALAAFNGLILTMGGHERAAMRASLGCLVLDLALCLALVPPLGAKGAAIAALVSITARNVVNSVAAWRRMGIDSTVLGRSSAAAPATRR